MESKDRIKASLNHESIDQLAVDFGATPVTGIHVLAIQNLREFFDLEERPIKVTEPYQMLGEIEEDLSEILGIDTLGISPRNTMFGFPNENFKEFKTPWKQVVLVPGQFNVSFTDAGDVLMYPEGDLSIEPCAKMPVNGFFFDALIRQEPIEEGKLDPMDNLEEFNEISDLDLNHFKREVDKYSNSGKAIVANFGGTAIGDIALVPGLNLKKPKGIRDVTEWYMSTVMRTDYIHEIFSKQTEIAVSNLKKIFSLVGNQVDVAFICGTDFGTQDSQFCSQDTFLSLYAPYYKQINHWIHQNTTWKTFKHSCGAVEPFMKHFIEAGFDIINPVQTNAAGMDPQQLKDKYGNSLVFWGGGVDTQRVFPFGTQKEIENQVLNHCEIFSKNGGYVFNTIHNLQANVPLENIIAMLRAIDKFNGKPTRF